MKRLILVVIALVFSFGTLRAYEKRDLLQNKLLEVDLAELLLPAEQWVAYPDYSDREGWSRLLGDSADQLIAEGERYLDNKWSVVKATDYIEFRKSGNRDIMQNPFNENRKALSTLFYAELAEGEGRFVKDIIDGSFAFCEMTSWALSAHLVQQKSGNSLPDYREHIIDLTSGDISVALSWIYYMLKDEFDNYHKGVADRIRYELQNRTIDTYMNVSRFWWMAFGAKEGCMVNNWNPWCNSSVLMTMLLIEDDKERLVEEVSRTMRSVDSYINYMPHDGGCEEGSSYWGHAGGKLLDYLTMLYSATGGRFSIFENEQIRNIGEFVVNSRVGDEWVFNFADASAKLDLNSMLVYRYGVKVNSPIMTSAAISSYDSSKPLYDGDVYRMLENFMILGELKEGSKSGEVQTQLPEVFFYPETEFYFMRNDNGFSFAAKGGCNAESHNHNDAGSSILYIKNRAILIDAGVGTYTRQTFSGERYSIWTMQSNYHNLPMINNTPQRDGAKYKATEIESSERLKRVSMNIASAYPEEAKVKSWVRSYELKDDKLAIGDRFILDEAVAANRVNFLTWGDVDISQSGEVLITVDGVSAKLSYDKRAFEISKEEVSITDPRLGSIWGDKIYRISLVSKSLKREGSYSFSVSCVE